MFVTYLQFLRTFNIFVVRMSNVVYPILLCIINLCRNYVISDLKCCLFILPCIINLFRNCYFRLKNIFGLLCEIRLNMNLYFTESQGSHEIRLNMISDLCEFALTTNSDFIFSSDLTWILTLCEFGLAMNLDLLRIQI